MMDNIVRCPSACRSSRRINDYTVIGTGYVHKLLSVSAGVVAICLLAYAAAQKPKNAGADRKANEVRRSPTAGKPRVSASPQSDAQAKRKEQPSGAPKSRSGSATAPTASPAKRAAAGTPVDRKPVSSAAALAKYQAILNRLDSAKRPPPKKGKPAPRPAPLPRPNPVPQVALLLKGTIVEPGQSFAILQDPTGKHHLVEEGDAVQGAFVDEVAKDRVTLVINEKKIVLHPVTDDEARKPARPRAATGKR